MGKIGNVYERSEDVKHILTDVHILVVNCS